MNIKALLIRETLWIREIVTRMSNALMFIEASCSTLVVLEVYCFLECSYFGDIFHLHIRKSSAVFCDMPREQDQSKTAAGVAIQQSVVKVRSSNSNFCAAVVVVVVVVVVHCTLRISSFGIKEAISSIHSRTDR